MSGKTNANRQYSRSAQRNRGGNGLLTGLAVLAGALAIYKRIPLTNRIGDNGNAYFGMAYDTYLFFFLFCGYSMQSVIARMTAARYAKGQYRNTRRVWNAAVLYTILFGIAGTAAMLLSSGILAEELFHAKPGTLVIRCMAPAVLVTSLLGALRGYFQGMGSMVPTALSRFVEELAGLLFMLALASGLGDYGQKIGALLRQPDYEQAFGAAGGALGFLFGSLLSLLLLALVYLMFQSSFRRRERKDAGKGMESYRRIGRVIAVSAFPVILTGFAMQGSFILDQILFLQLSPSGANTITQWGIYTGKYRILSSIPALLVTAVCTGLIPSLSVSFSSMNTGRMREKAHLMLKLALSISLPLALYFAVTAEHLVPALFTLGDTQITAGLLRAGAAAIVLQALGIASSCILQGLEQERQLLINAAVSLVLHAVFLVFLLQATDQGITGVVYSVIALYAVFMILNLVCALRILTWKGDWIRMILIPIISSAVMTLIVWALSSFLPSSIGSGLLSLICFLAGLIVYLLLMLALRGVTERDLRNVPGAGAILFIGRLLRFM